MNLKVSSALVVIAGLSLAAPVARAAGHLAGEVGVSSKGTRAGQWLGFKADADNYVVVQGPGMNNAKVLVDKTEVPLPSAPCAASLPNFQNGLVATCVKLEKALGPPYALEIKPSTGPAFRVELKEESTPEDEGAKDGSQNDGTSANTVCDRLREAMNAAVAKLAGPDVKWKTKWTVTDPLVCGANIYDADRAVLLFDEEGEFYDALPQVDEDDTIAVVVVPRDAEKEITDLHSSKCAAPKVLRIAGGARGGIVTPVARTTDKTEAKPVAMVVAKQCGSESGLEVTAKNGDAKVSISIPTLPLHRLTVGLGIFFDLSRASAVSAGQLKGESVPVLNEARSLEGIATAAVVSLRPYRVDTVRPRRRFWEMFAPAVGVSLTDPKDHLYFAINLEPFPGLGFLVGYHAFREEVLADGFAPGDRFPAGDLPKSKRWRWWGDGRFWKEPQIFLGLNLDTSLITDFLAALNR
jgi:hypothetical protein